jgi:hypothetical protein
MKELAFLLVPWAVRVSLIFALLIRDERTMPKAMLERAPWPSSRSAGAVYFDVLVVVVHYVKTRGWLRGLPMGVGFALLLIGCSVIATLLLALALGEPLDL